MIIGLHGNACAKSFAGILMLIIAATPAYAAIQVGGGATMPVIGYTGDLQLLNALPDPASLLGAYRTLTGTPVSYCQTGSSVGKNILAGVPGFNVQNNCTLTPPTQGFSAGQVGRPSLTQPNFAASDISLSSADYANYTANHASGRPLQFPALAGSIAIVYRNDNMSNTLALTAAQVCGIFNGSIVNWTDLGAPIPASGSNRLKVVYRGDTNGTSFGLGNYLAWTCPGTVLKHFRADLSFANVVGLYGLPSSNWVSESGNPAVVDEVNNTDGAIGFAETSGALFGFSFFATVNGMDPVADLGDPANAFKITVGVQDVVYNNAITGVDPNTGRPTYGFIPGAPTTGCIALVRPESYATQPANRYPIVTLSYLLGNSANNGTDLTDVRRLLGAPYNPSVIALTATVGANTGLAFLDLSAAGIGQAQVNGCVVN